MILLIVLQWKQAESARAKVSLGSVVALLIICLLRSKYCATEVIQPILLPTSAAVFLHVYIIDLYSKHVTYDYCIYMMREI